MDAAAQKIHAALETVSAFRRERVGNAALAAASGEIKRFQSKRFEATYPDLLRDPRHAGAARFFLLELYNDKDYSERDQQFARIAATITRMFPKAVAETAARLAEVHALSETLDDAMARRWLAASDDEPDPCRRYVRCWREVTDEATRMRQLGTVLELGRSLDRLTRLPGLRTLLRMMRSPARAAGLDSLQQFLEDGFDAFAAMRGAREFLELVATREAAWIARLSTEEAVGCATALRELMTAGHPH